MDLLDDVNWTFSLQRTEKKNKEREKRREENSPDFFSLFIRENRIVYAAERRRSSSITFGRGTETSDCEKSMGSPASYRSSVCYFILIGRKKRKKEYLLDGCSIMF